MKKPSFFFIWLMLLAVGLMIIITATQYVTKKSQVALEEGNKQAAITFSLNNRLEELVNLSFNLENKLTSKKKIDAKNLIGIKDSLTQLGYNTKVLQNTLNGKTQFAEFKKLSFFINEQVRVSFKVLEGNDILKPNFKNKYADTLASLHLADSVYVNAIVFQKQLENLLSKNFVSNNSSANNLARLNFLLAIVSLLAVLLLVTIIIKRQKKQLQLIRDLNESREAALQSGAVKDRFLANMSHEIRTPLNAVKGFSEMLSQTDLDSKQQKYSSIINSASDNLLAIVNDILDFSKIESDTIVIKQHPFNIETVMGEMQNMFEYLAIQKNLKLILENTAIIKNDLIGDVARLKQILINLIGNAIKFTGEGFVKISIIALDETAENVTLLFSISDTGSGIPADKINTIFERFEQVDNSFSRRQGGTGLGLAISKRLITLMNGTVAVESEINKGSTFKVTLPFKKSTEKVISKKPTAKAEKLTVSFSDKTILVVEDNYMNKLLLQSIFDKYNIVPLIVENGLKAIEAVEKNKIDVILMDVQMPEMDGIEATELIRKQYGSGIPIIAMTAHVLEQEKQRCLKAGMNDYITKPISEQILIEKLNKILENSPSESVKNTKVQAHHFFNYLQSICNDDESKMKIILQQLNTQIATDISTLKTIIATKDIIMLKKFVHNIKSTLSPIDAESPVVRAISQFEQDINTNSIEWEAIQKQAENLIMELKNCYKEIDNYIA